MLSKRIIILLCAVFGVLFTIQTPVLPQSKKPNSIYNEPSRLMFAGDENEVKEAESGTLLREYFYPIGWSKDGKFAYYTEPADEACGCYFAVLVIQDLKTDKVLWTHNNDKNASEENQTEDTIAKYWKKHQREFSRKLAQYGIVAQKSFTLLIAPIKYQKDFLTPEIIVNLKFDEDEKLEGNIIMRLLSKNKGTKTVYEKKYKKDYDSIRGAEIGGVLLSPFEPRTAMVLIETHRGYEGPPNITKLKIIGATLNGGFK